VDALKRTLDNNDRLSSFEEIVLSNFKKLYNVNNSNKNIHLNKKEKETLEQNL